jgi:hypothetical protein
MNATRTVRAWAIAAGIFGIATVASGGRALFGDEPARAAVGQAVGFVLWFNFVAGFAYIAAAIGLWAGAAWAGRLAVAIAVATAMIAVAFAAHVLAGGAYEPRTVAALLLRLGFWVWVARVGLRAARS